MGSPQLIFRGPKPKQLKSEYFVGFLTAQWILNERRFGVLCTARNQLAQKSEYRNFESLWTSPYAEPFTRVHFGEKPLLLATDRIHCGLAGVN